MTTRERRPQWRTRLIALTATAAIAIPFAAGTGVNATSSLFLPYQTISLGTTDSSAVAIGDVTGDGRADVVVTGSTGIRRLSRLRPRRTCGRDPRCPGLVRDRRGRARTRLQTVAIGDITGDGRADVVVGASSLGIQVFPQLDTGALGAPTLIETPDSLRVRIGNLGGGAGLDVVGIGWGTNTGERLPQRRRGQPRQPGRLPGPPRRL